MAFFVCAVETRESKSRKPRLQGCDLIISTGLQNNKVVAGLRRELSVSRERDSLVNKKMTKKNESFNGLISTSMAKSL